MKKLEEILADTEYWYQQECMKQQRNNKIKSHLMKMGLVRIWDKEKKTFVLIDQGLEPPEHIKFLRAEAARQEFIKKVKHLKEGATTPSQNSTAVE